jgi:hypothetical protein
MGELRQTEQSMMAAELSFQRGVLKPMRGPSTVLIYEIEATLFFFSRYKFTARLQTEEVRLLKISKHFNE